MKAIDFLAELDAIRSKLRASGDVKKIEINSTHSIIEDIHRLVNAVNTERYPSAVGTQEATHQLQLPGTGENPFEPEPPRVQAVVERGDGEGRMKVMARPTPFVVRKPVLEEVLEEAQKEGGE